MFANFTAETCTGTGDTVTLAGAVTDGIPFSGSFDDGDLVSYVITDGATQTKVAGIGTFNSVGTVTRNDTWNYNGTVVDKSPATNITLSAGTHTIRCTPSADSSSGVSPVQVREITGFVSDAYQDKGTGNVSMVVNEMNLSSFYMKSAVTLVSLGIANVVTAATTGSKARLALYEQRTDGFAGKLIAQTTDIDITTTGFNKSSSLITPVTLKAGMYFLGIISDGNAVIAGRGVNGTHPHMPSSGTVGGYRAAALRYNTIGAWTEAPDLSGINPDGAADYNKNPTLWGGK